MQSMKVIHPKSNYVFRRHANIGATAAEHDQEFLYSCFIDTGDLPILTDCRNPRRIVVGRTGTGKSALLRMLATHKEHVIELAPESLSLSYITNSTILRFFEELGIKLDIFYTLLWRHVFTVELLKAKFNIQNETTQKHFLTWLKPLFFRERAKEKALSYLEEWGNQFWKETEYRIREFTTKLEKDLSASLEASGQINQENLKADLSYSKNLTEEQKGEVLNRAQQIVNSVQIKDLHEVIRLLSDDIFNDPQQHYYITIDRLDENWIDDRLRYKLIRSLIEEVRTYQRVNNVKIIIAIRTDLLERVLRSTKDSGFQEEKYHSLYLPLKWDREQLTDLLDSRVNRLIREQYTKTKVGIRDILPTRKVNGKDYLTYIFDRTFNRPREVIQFLNDCLGQAEGKAAIAVSSIHKAEQHYSRVRLRSLADEWQVDFPLLHPAFKLLENRPIPFEYKQIEKTELNSLLIEIFEQSNNINCPIMTMIQECINNQRTLNSMLSNLFRIFYQTGIIGVKLSTVSPVQWSFEDEPTLSSGQMKPTTPIYIHPTFHMALGIDSRLRAARAMTNSEIDSID